MPGRTRQRRSYICAGRSVGIFDRRQTQQRDGSVAVARSMGPRVRCGQKIGVKSTVAAMHSTKPMLSSSRRFALSVPRIVIASTTDIANTISVVLNTFIAGL